MEKENSKEIEDRRGSLRDPVVHCSKCLEPVRIHHGQVSSYYRHLLEVNVLAPREIGEFEHNESSPSREEIYESDE